MARVSPGQRNQLKPPPKKIFLPKEKAPTKAAVKSQARVGQLPPPPKTISLNGTKPGINPNKKINPKKK
jgi:hypothetical protein